MKFGRDKVLAVFGSRHTPWFFFLVCLISIVLYFINPTKFTANTSIICGLTSLLCGISLFVRNTNSAGLNAITSKLLGIAISVSLITFVFFFNQENWYLFPILTSLTIATLVATKWPAKNTKPTKPLFVVGIIIILSTIVFGIKIGYYNADFSGEHSLKYALHTGAAQAMFNENSLFFYQKNYLANPLIRQSIISEKFDHPPLIEWGIFFVKKLNSDVSYETATRVTMTTLGLIAVLSLFFLSKNIFGTGFAIIASLMFTTNPIFNFATFLPNQEIIGLIFSLTTLLLITESIRHKSVLLLTISLAFLGMGLSSRISIIIYMIPIVSFLFLYDHIKSNAIDKLVATYKLGIYLTYAALLFVIYRILISLAPSSLLLSGLGVSLTIVILISFFKLIKHEGICIELALITQKYPWRILSVICPLTIISCIVGIKLFIGDNFLPDARLFFDINYYVYIFKEQVSTYLTQPIFYLIPVGILTTLFCNYSHYQKGFLLSFIAGSMLFAGLASKALPLHNYYTLPILLITILLVTTFILFVYKQINALIILTLFVFLLLPPIQETRLKLSETREGFAAAAKFLSSHTEDGQIILTHNNTLGLNISLPNNPVVLYFDDFMNNLDIRKEIKENGFGTTLHKHNVYYFVTTDERIDLPRLANFFSNEDLSTNFGRRIDQVRSMIYPEVIYYQDAEIRDKVIEENGVAKKFELLFDRGRYKIYGFKD